MLRKTLLLVVLIGAAYMARTKLFTRPLHSTDHSMAETTGQDESSGSSESTWE